MKKILVIFITLMTFWSCKDSCKQTYTYTIPVPIYLSNADYEKANGQWKEPHHVLNTGKIFVRGEYILIVEKEKGVHFIDNSNINAPKNIGFLQVYGNVDIAVKGNTLYLDSHRDLLYFDITDINKPIKIGKNENVFEHKRLAFTNGMRDSVAIGFEIKQKTVIRSCDEPYIMPFFSGVTTNLSSSGSGSQNQTVSSGGNQNQAGSMASFTTVGNYLYTVEPDKMYVFDISNGQKTTLVNTIKLDWGVETVFASDGKLFLGTRNGMRIYSLQTPINPQFLGVFEHPIACDPVVVQNNLAYVTTRSGNMCANAQNQLDIVSIADPQNPQLIKSYEMQNPHGLAVKGNDLIVCEGAFGFKKFDVNDPKNIILQNKNSELYSFDVIMLPNSFLIASRSGIYQYNYDFQLISQISNL
ncbi:MAG: hypothetical protein MUC49_02720 [Raineya sp.]|jgi:hypothetical protein|nr:hypothetical protein [Raineya sp.]